MKKIVTNITALLCSALLLITTSAHADWQQPELGSNLMFFFFREWEELLQVPDLERLNISLRNASSHC